MQVAGSPDSITPRTGPAAHSSDVGAGEQKDEDIFKNPVDEEGHSREVSMLPFGSQKYNRKRIWPTISHGDKVTSPLRAVS